MRAFVDDLLSTSLVPGIYPISGNIVAGTAIASPSGPHGPALS
jgi:hypothetical protein